MSASVRSGVTHRFAGVDSLCAKEAASTRRAPPAAAKWSFVFLWLFTIAVFARPEDIFKTPFHFELIFGSAAAVAYLCALMTQRAKLSWSHELTLLFLLTAWFILGVAFAFWKRGSFDVLTQVWLKTFLIFFLLTQTLSTISRIRKVVWAIILSELIVTTISIFARSDEALHVGARLAGINENLLGWNYLGIAVAMTLPYIATLYVARPSLVQTGLLLATVCMSMWMVVLTASRGGFLGVVLSILLTWWFILRRSRRGQIVGVLIAVCLLIAAAKAPKVFWLRLQTVWSWSDLGSNEAAVSAKESAEGRNFLLVKSIEYTLQHPGLGAGLGNFKVVMGTEGPRRLGWFATHNTFTQVSSEGGIPALLMFLLFLSALIRHMKKISQGFDKNPPNEEIGLLARATLVSVLAFAFEGLFASVAYDYFLYYPAGIAIGLYSIYQQSAGASNCRAESRELFLRPPLSKRSSEWR